MSDVAFTGVVLLQGGILAITLEALRRRNFAAVVNGFVSFVAVFVPVGADYALRIVFARGLGYGPELLLWIAAAGLLHSFGMLGPYDSIWWWDHLTHTVSAALVAALVYAGLVVVAREGLVLGVSPGAVGLLTVALTVALGAFWEVIELVAREVGERYDVEPILVHYGWRDTALDVVFDVVGALLVVVADVRIFVAIADRFPGATRAFVLGSAVVAVVGSVLLALVAVFLGR